MDLNQDNVVPLLRRPRYLDALVPPDQYEARVLDFETRFYWRGASRLVVWWMIVELGSAFEARGQRELGESSRPGTDVRDRDEGQADYRHG